MRQVVLDTETTGLHADGSPPDRIIEIGCVEINNRRRGKTFQCYINPGRKVSEGALKIHGITDEFLADKPSFEQIYDDFMDFIKDAELISHNAPFDMGFLNAEMRHMDIEPLPNDFVDTLKMALTMHPGYNNNLDALCKRYGVDGSHRDLHGALLDAELLVHVYLRMTMRQDCLLGEDEVEAMASQIRRLDPDRKPLPRIQPSAEEIARHEQWFAELKVSSQKMKKGRETEEE